VRANPIYVLGVIAIVAKHLKNWRITSAADSKEKAATKGANSFSMFLAVVCNVVQAQKYFLCRASGWVSIA
jgi:hypothetical protein